jgi:hypothetical protein
MMTTVGLNNDDDDDNGNSRVGLGSVGLWMSVR